jgi:hypothetical protein
VRLPFRRRRHDHARALAGVPRRTRGRTGAAASGLGVAVVGRWRWHVRRPAGAGAAPFAQASRARGVRGGCDGRGRGQTDVLQPTGGVGLVGTCVAFAGLPRARRVRQSGRDLGRGCGSLFPTRGAVGFCTWGRRRPVVGTAIKSYDLVKKTATIFFSDFWIIKP